MRKKIVAANWKMHLSFAEAMALTDAFLHGLDDSGGLEVLIAPPFPYIHEVLNGIQRHPLISVAAQNCSEHNNGAYTGEVSAYMLASVGVEFVITGHSERRKYYGDIPEVISRKVDRILEHRMSPLFCCGETLEDRNSGKHFDVITGQIRNSLGHLSVENMKSVVIAYEPVWAIGTGINATTEQAGEMHRFIRNLLSEIFSDDVSSGTSILYGGSLKPDNATELFSCEDIDGGLVGGSSLRATEFLTICRAMETACSR